MTILAARPACSWFDMRGRNRALPAALGAQVGTGRPARKRRRLLRGLAGCSVAGLASSPRSARPRVKVPVAIEIAEAIMGTKAIRS